MMKAFNTLFNIVLFTVLPGIAGAAGTYYNNNPYQRYGTNNNGYNNYGRSYASRYGQQATGTINQPIARPITQTGGIKKITTNNTKKQGFVANMGLSHEFANWTFDMQSSGSRLYYDNIAWNVLDGNVAYYFGESTPMQLKVGGRYGMQFDESPMVDDDITNGGYLVTTWYDGTGTNIIGYQTGHALSIGTSKGGTQMGLNASIGLTDFFKWGRVKMTPSIGYRYLKYKLKTEKNYGATIDIFEATTAHTDGSGNQYITCINDSGEIQCDPFLLFYGYDQNGQQSVAITGYTSNTNYIVMPTSLSNVYGVSVGGTYYYEQPGTSHEYTTTWAGPYLAMDVDYEIDNKNAVSGGIELGLPYYTSEGNQPYRSDWQHPKSVEDSGKLGDAVHVGLNAMWKTTVSESTMLTLGFSYDYYKVSKATAKTFLSPTYYSEWYSYYQEKYNAAVEAGNTELQADYQAELDEVDGYRASGWVIESPNEISSLYKSMGIRLGIEMKF